MSFTPSSVLTIVLSYIFNGLALYNTRNRIEYLKLLVRKAGSIPRLPVVEVVSEFLPQVAVVISLPNRTDKRTFMRQQLAKERINFYFFDAIEIDRTECTANYSDLFHSISLKFLEEGALGCWVSHCLIWKEALNDCSSRAIYEDDVKLCQDYTRRLNRVLASLPSDFDLVLINSSNTSLHNVRAYLGDHIFIPYQLRNGLFSYIVSPIGAKKLLDLVPSVAVARGGIDSAVGSLIRDRLIKAYHIRGELTHVDYSFKSDIR